MLKATDIANFFISLSNSAEEGHITNMKVNKLVYFAQAWSMVTLKQKLFDEKIEAWPHGPVIPSVYNAFNQYKNHNINEPCGIFDENVLTSEQLDLLTDVALAYGAYSAAYLRGLTHKPGTPWNMVYEEHKRNVIPDKMIYNYFKKQPPMFKNSIEKENFVGYRDNEGYLVLPKELNE